MLWNNKIIKICLLRKTEETTWIVSGWYSNSIHAVKNLLFFTKKTSVSVFILHFKFSFEYILFTHNNNSIIIIVLSHDGSTTCVVYEYIMTKCGSNYLGLGLKVSFDGTQRFSNVHRYNRENWNRIYFILRHCVAVNITYSINQTCQTIRGKS